MKTVTAEQTLPGENRGHDQGDTRVTQALHRCRFCNTALRHTLVDLGMSPVANAYLTAEQTGRMERSYPLHVYICDACYLVQLPVLQTPEEIFSEYAYFSSFSETWLKHASDYTDMMVRRFGYTAGSTVIEIASNDGYLLQYFRKRGIPVLGIEPARNVADHAVQSGIPTVMKFFGSRTAEELASEGKKADLLIGNNVFAHVPDINDFTAGMKIILNPQGIITMEFPHLMRLVEENQFDTIYHEHFSYFSFITAEKIFAHHGLTVFDVEELPTHGGSLRVYARHAGNHDLPVSVNVAGLRQKEETAGMATMQYYYAFTEKVKETKRNILTFLIEAKKNGKTVAGYGAPAKGNTLLNYCGIRTDFIDFTVDRSPHKQNLFLPGTLIPICQPEKIRQTRPDYLVILPWNLREEIMDQMSYIRDWGGKFVVFIPGVKEYA